ncbi:hypothetical protein HYS97_02255 [Candidatus Daviesbacteria bacterium]|nr:hypothetical protein [Candidatus Daviesbacteria bacterium]
MLNSKAFANAVTLVTAVFYVICLAISVAAPEFLFGIGRSWMHSINLEAIKATTTPSFQTSIWGLITISAVTWVTTFATIELYNRLAKK